jgi:hypothetical protein
MTAPEPISQLIEDILAAPDEAEIVDLLVRNADLIAALPPRERERACKSSCPTRADYSRGSPGVPHRVRASWSIDVRFCR